MFKKTEKYVMVEVIGEGLIINDHSDSITARAMDHSAITRDLKVEFDSKSIYVVYPFFIIIN